MTEPFIGEIACFGFDFAPRGWAKCDGQLLPIAQYTALFSLIGTRYGGDGRTTFGLPDLRGRVSLHQGHGPGLSDHMVGAKGGDESVALTPAQLPVHSHTVATGRLELLHSKKDAGGIPTYIQDTSAAEASSNVGSNSPHPNMPPYLVMNWCIALEGVFPSRS